MLGNAVAKMRIRLPQLNALARVCHDAFHARLRDHLHQCFPDFCNRLGEAGLSTFVAQATARGRILHLESEWELVRYIDLAVVFGSNFESVAAMRPVREIFENLELNGRTRIMLAYAVIHDMPEDEVI